MEYIVDVCKLSQKFYNDYPEYKYPEIMHKEQRPYTCLFLEIHEGYFICIPFRSSISHNDAFLFKSTRRSMHSRSGLDYQKTVVIKNVEYIDTNNSIVVDRDEYISVIKNLNKIVNEIHKYINRYINHINGISILHTKEFQRHYKYSTLQYFHDVLGLKT